MPDYTKPPKHLRVPRKEDLLKLPRWMWTDPKDFQPSFQDHANSPGDYLEWGMPEVRARACVCAAATFSI